MFCKFSDIVYQQRKKYLDSQLYKDQEEDKLEIVLSHREPDIDLTESSNIIEAEEFDSIEDDFDLDSENSEEDRKREEEQDKQEAADKIIQELEEKLEQVKSRPR